VKLEGSLDAFGLPDIFQLLSLTKKTGGLHLRSGASVGVVYFTDGAVTGADADLARQTLARRLVGSGTVSDDALVSAVKRAGSDGVGVGRALLDAGAVDPDLLREAASEVAYDAVFGLLGWPEGDFAFSPDAVNPDDVGMHLATEQVVSQAGSRQLALDESADVIASPDAVLAMAVVLPAEPELTREEWALVALADGGRPVAEIVDLTGGSYFDVVPRLAALVRKGLLEVHNPDSADADHVTKVRRRLELLAPLEGGTAAPAQAAPATPAAKVATPAEPAETTVKPAEPVSAPTPAVPVPVVEASVSAIADESDEELAAEAHALVSTIGGPHVPEDVVPPRPEPFIARRQPEHPDGESEPVAVPTGRGGFGSSAPTAGTSPGLASPDGPSARGTSGSVFSSQPGAGDDGLAGARASLGTVGSVGTAAGGLSAGSVASGNGGVGAVIGSAAMAADPESAALIERDPSVNRSLLLRLIAGVRGL
jgi:hypothetical protein